MLRRSGRFFKKTSTDGKILDFQQKRALNVAVKSVRDCSVSIREQMTDHNVVLDQLEQHHSNQVEVHGCGHQINFAKFHSAYCHRKSCRPTLVEGKRAVGRSVPGCKKHWQKSA